MKEFFKKSKKQKLILLIAVFILTFAFAFICFDIGRYYEANRINEFDERQKLYNGPCYRIETFSMDVDMSPYLLKPEQTEELPEEIPPDQAKL